MSYFKALQREHRCELHSCGNFGLTCLIVNKRHFKMNSNDLKIWNNAILQGKTTIHTPSIELHPIQSKIKRKRKHYDGYSSEPEDDHHSRHHGMVNVHVHNDSSSKHHSTRRYYSSSPVSPPHHSPARVSSRPSPSKITISLEEYIKMFIDKYPDEAPEYCLALEILQREHCKIRQLLYYTPDMWKVLGIPLGIGVSLSQGFESSKSSKSKKSSPASPDAERRMYR